jgi:SAM-dependent methyltransferase
MPAPPEGGPSSPTPSYASDPQRFEFGENWRRFASLIDEERIAEAQRSLRDLLEVSSLEGSRFLDIGCGSGLFSLAAVHLGAAHVHSFDFDPESVACTQSLREAQRIPASKWSVERGSVLDREYMLSLGAYEIVYAWGVLHHTGALWRAMEGAAVPVPPRGALFISIYNDQGRPSRIWKRLKQIYNRLPGPLRAPYVILVMAPLEARNTLYRAMARLRPMRRENPGDPSPSSRGMSWWHNLVDWVGGYPFEVARPDEVFDFYRARGFTLSRLVLSPGWGCNEYVFRRESGLRRGRAPMAGQAETGAVANTSTFP